MRSPWMSGQVGINHTRFGRVRSAGQFPKKCPGHLCTRLANAPGGSIEPHRPAIADVVSPRRKTQQARKQESPAGKKPKTTGSFKKTKTTGSFRGRSTACGRVESFRGRPNASNSATAASSLACDDLCPDYGLCRVMSDADHCHGQGGGKGIRHITTGEGHAQARPAHVCCRADAQGEFRSCRRAGGPDPPPSHLDGSMAAAAAVTRPLMRLQAEPQRKTVSLMAAGRSKNSLKGALARRASADVGDGGGATAPFSK
eukprot:gene17135-biopygen9374